MAVITSLFVLAAALYSGVAALFILLDSAARVGGNLVSVRKLPPELPLFLLTVAPGGAFGPSLGVRFVPRRG